MRNTSNDNFNINEKYNQWEIQTIINITLMIIQPLTNTINENYNQWNYNINEKYKHEEIDNWWKIQTMTYTSNDEYNINETNKQ